MSDTPRTDALVKKIALCSNEECQLADLCRSLERSLNEAVNQVAAWEDFARALTGTNAKDHGTMRACLEADVRQMRHDLQQAQEEIAGGAHDSANYPEGRGLRYAAETALQVLEAEAMGIHHQRNVECTITGLQAALAGEGSCPGCSYAENSREALAKIRELASDAMNDPLHERSSLLDMFESIFHLADPVGNAINRDLHCGIEFASNPTPDPESTPSTVNATKEG